MKPLSLNEMLNLKGGVSVEEYCRTLGTIMANNKLEGDSAKVATMRWNEFCA